MNWFLKNLRDAESAKTAKLVIVFSLGMSISTFVFVPILYYLSGPLGGTFLAILAPLIGSAVLVLRWTGSVALAAQTFLFWFWVLLTGIAIFMGQRMATPFPAYAILILGATFLVGRRSGIVWAVISIASVFTVFLTQGHIVTPLDISPEELEILYILTVASILGLVCVFALQYDTAKSTALGELQDANLRITRMIMPLEAASERLRDSSNELVGSDHEAHRGLVGQMLEKAREGREAMITSRESISGMIDQYRHIADRVKALHDHSQVIIDIVSTIDRISDRLDIMALNVGIEAAHGGEASRQFSILAGDMRLLAERVLQETRQIKAALHKVHEQVKRVLESSTSGQELTEESANSISSMAATFDDIFLLIEQAEGATGQMTVDALAQLDAVRQLVTAASDSGPPTRPAS